MCVFSEKGHRLPIKERKTQMYLEKPSLGVSLFYYLSHSWLEICIVVLLGYCIACGIDWKAWKKSQNVFRDTPYVIYLCLAWQMAGTYCKKKNVWIIEPPIIITSIRSSIGNTKTRNRAHRNVNFLKSLFFSILKNLAKVSAKKTQWNMFHFNLSQIWMK